MRKKKERWEYLEPYPGAQLRVSRDGYFHHGIYTDDGTVIHFTGPVGDLDCPKENRVRETSLGEFLRGGFLEVRRYSLRERRQRRSAEEIVACARSHLGEGGYDALRNNCEHFSNLCVFGDKRSAQTDGIDSTGKAGRSVKS